MDLRELANLLNSRSVTLFLGAGSSISAGGPNGNNLLESIRSQFNQPRGMSLFEMMKNIMGNTNSGRAEAEAFVRMNLSSISLTDDHRYLFSLPWRAILTTNYDQIPNMVIETLDKRRRIKPVLRVNDEVDVDREDDTLYCFKIFGDSLVKYPTEGYMVLTENDRRRAYRVQSELYKKFADLSASGTIVYAGYSFRDEFVFDMLEDLKLSAEGLPWKGYAIMSNRPDSAILERMNDLNIEWVQGSIEAFLKECKEIHKDKPISAIVRPLKFLVHQSMIGLDRTIQVNIQKTYHLLNASDFDYDTSPPDFMIGKDTKFEPFKRGWYFERKFRCNVLNSSLVPANSIAEFVSSRKSKPPSENTLFLITGAGGSGKTVLARRIAHEWYIQGNPVIFLNDVGSLDKIFLSHLLDTIRTEYEKLVPAGQSRKPLRYLVVAENCKAHHDKLILLQDHFKSAIKPVDILLVERNSVVTPDRIKSLGVGMVLELNDSVTKQELGDFIDHFERLGLLRDKYSLINSFEDPEINESFFSLLYSCVHGVQETLRKSITKEYLDMDDEDKKIYTFASIFRAYGQTCYIPLLHRIIGVDSSIIKQKANTSLRSVITLDPFKETIRVNHRVIAEVIIDVAFMSLSDLKNAVIQIIRCVNPRVINQVDLLHDLVIGKISIEGRLRKFSFEDSKEIFEAAIEIVRSAALLHHFAKLYLENKKLEKSRELVNSAYKTGESLHQEKEHYIKDTEARLEIAEAKKAFAANEVEKAREHLISAETIYKGVQEEGNATKYHYEGLALTYYEFAKLSNDINARTSSLINALGICAKYKHMVWNVGTEVIDRLLAQLLTEFAAIGFNVEKARELARTQGNANGFAFLAQRIHQEENASSALQLVNEGIGWDKGSEWLNRLRIEYLKEAFPADTKTLGKALVEWEANSGRSKPTSLLFELAKFKYCNGRIAEAMDIFRDLRLNTRDNPGRHHFDPQMDAWLDDGKPKVFFGVLVLPPSFETWGEIECTSEKLHDRILAPLQGMRYENFESNEEVSFNIVFNLLGPQATNVIGS